MMRLVAFGFWSLGGVYAALFVRAQGQGQARGVPGGSGVPAAVYARGQYGGDLVSGGGDVRVVDGSEWRLLAPTDGWVAALLEFRGELIVAGVFSTIGGVAANNIARWDGHVWRPLGEGLDRGVFALAEFTGDLVAGGEFNRAGSIGFSACD